MIVIDGKNLQYSTLFSNSKCLPNTEQRKKATKNKDYTNSIANCNKKGKNVNNFSKVWLAEKHLKNWPQKFCHF